jgi:hypothetical protein
MDFNLNNFYLPYFEALEINFLRLKGAKYKKNAEKFNALKKLFYQEFSEYCQQNQKTAAQTQIFKKKLTKLILFKSKIPAPANPLFPVGTILFENKGPQSPTGYKKTNSKRLGKGFFELIGQEAEIYNNLENFALQCLRHTSLKEAVVADIITKDQAIQAGIRPHLLKDLFPIKKTQFYLAPTREIPLLAICEKNEKLFAITDCYRQEIGKTKYLTRMDRAHYFKKAEMFAIVPKETEKKTLLYFRKISFLILKSLGIPCTAKVMPFEDIAHQANLTIDIETLRDNQPFELRSISTCGTYQLQNNKKNIGFVSLNGTALSLNRVFTTLLNLNPRPRLDAAFFANAFLLFTTEY